MENEIRYPHLKDSVIDKVVSGSSIDLHIRIDTNVHTYLKEHIFDGECFVPATMIMELLMEAAFYYQETILQRDVREIVPDRLEDLQIKRSLRLKVGSSLEIHIKVDSINTNLDSPMNLIIYSNRFNSKGEVLGVRENVSARVYVKAKKEEVIPFHLPYFEQVVYQLDFNDTYQTMFPSLGEHFQTCTGKIILDHGKKYFIGEYVLHDKEMSCVINQQTEFLTSPLGNDACLQLAVLFSRSLNLIGRLPIGGELIEFHRKDKRGKVKVFVECLEIDDDMKCNITSFDEEGILVRMKNFVVRKSPYHSIMKREELDKWLRQYQINERN